MKKYNKFMLTLWLVVSILSAIVVTFKGITEGFDRWYSYYILTGISLFMYVTRRWMMKRMDKHMDFLNNKTKE